MILKSSTPPDMKTHVNCEMCDWAGVLSACIDKETYHVTNTNHHYTCPNCGCDVYNWVEDKRPDESADGLDDEVIPGSPPPRYLPDTDSEEEV